MFLRFSGALASYRVFTVDEADGDNIRRAITIKMELKQTRSRTGDTCTIDNKINAFELPIVLAVSVGKPFGPIDPRNFDVRLPEDREEFLRPKVPIRHFGTIVYVPRDQHFSEREHIGIDATISEESFGYLWDGLKSGHKIESIFIEGIGSSLFLESVDYVGSYRWHWQSGNASMLICNKIAFVFCGETL
jgi:hypothetical protein